MPQQSRLCFLCALRAKMHINDLPEETLDQIVTYLSRRSIFSVQLVDRRFCRIATPTLYRHISLTPRIVQR